MQAVGLTAVPLLLAQQRNRWSASNFDSVPIRDAYLHLQV